MGEITALKARGGRVEVCIDGVLSFNVSIEVASRLEITVGRCLSADEIQELLAVEAVERCLAAALRLLKYRPRSRIELKRRLLGRGFPEASVDRALALLEERGFIDDVAFARYWIDNRARFKPMGVRLMSLELKRKGVSDGVVQEATRSLDDEALAYQAGLKKARALARFPEEEFCRRLYGFLRRRGFTDGVIRSVLRRLWEVCSAANDEIAMFAEPSAGEP